MTTLIQVWTNELNTHTASVTAAKAEMSAAQSTLASARKQLDTDTAALKTLIADIASNKGKLANAAVPSEVAVLNTTIRDQLIDQRRLQGVILDDQDAVAAATAQLDVSTQAMNRANTLAASAKTALDAATKSGEERDKRKTVVNDKPLKTLKADATAFAAGTVASDGQSVMNANLPAELQDLLVERHATQLSRGATLENGLAEADTSRAGALGAVSGVGGEVVEKEIGFVRADGKLKEYVETAKRSYDRAVSVFSDLQKIKTDAKKNPDILTAAQKSDLKASVERIAAAKKAIEVDNKLDAVIDAEKNLDAGILTSIDTDVDAVAADPAVTGLRKAVDDAVKDLDKSRAALVAGGEKKLMDEWQIIVPDTVWQRFVEYSDAAAILAELKSTDPAVLVTDLDTAENLYASAIAKAAKAQRRVDAYSDAVQLRSKRGELARAALPARVFSAVRGDSY